MDALIIDVREKDEFDAEHIEGSIHIPLSEFTQKAPALMSAISQQPITLMCLGGKRALMALQEANQFGIKFQKIEVYAGGITAWKKNGLPVIQAKKSYLSIMRQTQIAIGVLIIGSLLLGMLVSNLWLFMTLGIGTGLIIAGTTGFCGMAILISKMPWNAQQTEVQSCSN